MRFCVAAVTLFTLASSALSSVIPLTVEKYNGKTNGKYIVQLVEGADKAPLYEQIKASSGEVTHDYSKVINGFAGVFSDSLVKVLLGSPLVKSVSEDGLVSISGPGAQYTAPWGISRISNTCFERDTPDLKYLYYYPDDSLGSGVDIYIVDTGVRTTHVAFENRARWGATFGPYADADGNGHGTHVAGTAAGAQYGVAQKASIIAVKAISDNGSGTISDLISALEWVFVQALLSGRPSVVNLSLSGGASTAIDNSVRTLTVQGIHVVAAAGNRRVDAKDSSPAREPSAVTVGASTIHDERAGFSNFGSVVDIFAPGHLITSAWKDSDTAIKTISGTSMAAPHVAGLIAYLIKAEGNLSTDDMSDKLKELALEGVLSDIPSGTVNLLAQNHKS